MLTLYYAPGAVSFAPHMLLQELEIPHELCRIETGDEEQHRPEYLRINPLARVPALRLDDGRVLTETAAILQYIAALKPEARLVPDDPWSSARCYEWLSLIGTSLQPAYAFILRPDRVEPDTSTHAALRKTGRERFLRLLAHAEGQVPEQGFLLGPELSVADPYLLVMVLWARFIGAQLDDLPRLAAWSQRVGQRPSFLRTLRAERLIDDTGKPTPPARV